jgi:hypothetical protein
MQKMGIKMYFSLLSGWLFGLLFFLIGLVNTFWSNDPGFGFFVTLCCLLYIPPVSLSLSRFSAISIPVPLKAMLGIFLHWASLGVAELHDKIGLMLTDLR